MKFMVNYCISDGSVVEAQQRLMKTGGAPPKGLTMIGRWQGMSGTGVLIAETGNAKALYSWLSAWTDLLEFESTPCVEDAEAGEVTAAIKR